MIHLKTVLLAFLAFIASSPVLSQTVAVTVAAKEELPYFGRNLPGQGLSAEIVRTALERAGYSPSFVFKTWADTYEGAQIGVYDIVGSIWYTEERAKEFAFSEPYLFHEIKFIKRKDGQAITFKTLDDLDGLIIGTVKGYAYRDDFLQSKKFIRVQQNHLLQNLNALALGEIDLTPGEARKIRYVLNEYMKGSIEKLEMLPTPLIRRGTHIAVSRTNPKHEEIISRFNKALQEMKADGTYDRIVEKHAY
jgi:polar amino acid transport system substrate-binding protein